jgi:phosphate starvation-inducible protein PhoH and related proteins
MSKKKRLRNEKRKAEQDKESIDKSPVVYQKSKIQKQLNIIHHDDLTDKQKEFIKLALDRDTKIIFMSGPAGSSKSFLSVLVSLELMNSKKVSDIIYVRSVVESTDHKMGYLPGDADEKLSPYMEPLLDKLDELLVKADVDFLVKEKRVQAKPTGFLRGLNWNAKAIIVDEAQNNSLSENTTILTRIGKFSKMFLCGDPMQSDINGKSGFAQMVSIFDNEESRKQGIHVFNFFKEDIVRSEIVKYIVGMIEEYKKLKTMKN